MRVCPDVIELETDEKKVTSSSSWSRCFFLLTNSYLIYAAPFSDEVRGKGGRVGKKGT